MPRSVRVRVECIETVKLALRRNGYARQSDLVEKVNISKNTVNKFFTGKPIDYLNFVEICNELSLDWQEIADLEGEKLPQKAAKSNTPEQSLSVTKEVNRNLEVNLPDRGDSQTDRAREKRVILQQAIPNVPVWKGRDELLEELQTKLLQSENPPKVLAIIGQGGIGKTSLAVKLLEVLGVCLGRSPLTPLNKGGTEEDCLYNCVMYFKAQEGTSFDDVAEFLLDGLGIETPEPLKTADEKIGKIIAGLADTRCLLVLDNLESVLHPANHPQAGKAVSLDWGKLLNALVYQQHISQTILTSREVPADLADTRYEGAEPDTELVHIETLTGVSNRAGVEILEQRQLKDKPEDLQWVSGRVEGHVFLLTQLASLGKGKPGYLRKHPELVTKKAEPILQEQLGRQSDAARDLLKRMCVLRVPIDVRGLTFLRLYTDDREKDDRFLNAAELGEPAELTESEIRETEAILERLVDSSLVQCRYDEEKCELFYDLHQVIAEFLEKKYQNKLFDSVKRAYLFFLSGRNVENPQSLSELCSVIEAVFYAFLLEDYSTSANLVATILEKYLRPWGYWDLLNGLYEEILPYVKHNERLMCLEGIGRTYLDIGDWELAKNFFNDALSIAKKQGNARRVDILLGLLNLINIEEKRLNFQNQLVQLRQSLLEKEPSYNYPDENLEMLELTESERHDLNQLHQSLDEEINLLENATQELLQVSEEAGNHNGIAMAIGSFGRVELYRRNFESAKNLLTKALAKFEERRMIKNIAEANYDLAQLYRQRNNPELAQQHYNTAHQIFQQLGAAKDLEKIEKEWQNTDLNADTRINEN